MVRFVDLSLSLLLLTVGARAAPVEACDGEYEEPISTSILATSSSSTLTVSASTAAAKVQAVTAAVATANAVSGTTGGASGTPVGFALSAGVTGGGDATPAEPADAAELKTWLEDDVARVIIISKEYNFIGTEGTCEDCDGCIPDSYTCDAGQLAIAVIGWCDPYPAKKITYDNAGMSSIEVKANKSLIGTGSGAVIRGKGLRIVNGAENIIIQNVHFTEINPQFIWGGDAIILDGTDKIWIDHCKFSLVGRQMFVTGYEASGRVTLSYNEFDGNTDWSASCDGRHYWAFLGLGDDDLITLYGNYFHHTSGRTPKLGNKATYHALNNYWYSNTGHAFDVSEGSDVLIEGNVFEDVKTPLMASDHPGLIFVPESSTTGSCTESLERACVSNTLTSSGTLVGTDTGFLSNFTGYSVPDALESTGVKAFVLANAGVGKL
ncbi:pectin lyase [Phlyctema vagabunda]|uniref:pectin lyase n=1 Tax=Phlyctema vagabunda TaxID=108571 RepID=A0ABR4PPI6_9HELO